MTRKLLVVVDERAVSQSVIQQGIELAVMLRAEILFFHMLPQYNFPAVDILPIVDIAPEAFERECRADAKRRLAVATVLAEAAGVFSHTALGSGTDDAQCIADAAIKRQCDWIMVGTEARNAVVRLLSESIVPGLISFSTVPVFVCKETKQAPGSGRRHMVALRARRKREELLERRYAERND